MGGHLLGTGDERGQVVLMDTRKRAKQSVITGTTTRTYTLGVSCLTSSRGVIFLNYVRTCTLIEITIEIFKRTII